MNFLEQTVHDILEKHGNDLKEIYFVFPNRRAGIFFQRYLGRALNQPIFSPQLATIQDFIALGQTKQVADKLTQSFVLFEAYNTVLKHENEAPIDYEKFYSLGEILLSDFSDIDTYLVNYKQLYANIYDLEELAQDVDYFTEKQLEFLRKFWQLFDLDNLQRQKERFLKLWKILPQVYELFNAELAQKGLITSGVLYRQLAEQSDALNYCEPFKKIIFIGFSALNKAEETIFKKLQKAGKALFYWDVDPYYMQEKEFFSDGSFNKDFVQQEAGEFLRKNIYGLGLTNELKESKQSRINRPDRSIEVIGANGSVMQAKAIGQVIQDKIEQLSQPEDLAIVLADESMLVSVLEALPQWIEKQSVNVTMGYPFVNTHLYGWVQLLFRTHKNRQGSTFFHADVEAFLRHPFMLQHSQQASELLADMLINKRIRVDQEILFALNLPIATVFFQSMAAPIEIFDRLIVIAETVLNEQNTAAQETDTPTISFIEFQAFKVLNKQLVRLGDLLQTSIAQGLSFEFLELLLRKMLRAMSIPFSGEPIRGVQIMGILETRALDFNNLVILGMNEGVLPKVAAGQTLIPFTMREAFDLPTIRHQDAIFAYYFYRLLQHPKKIWLLFNQVVSESSTGEVSRFVEQLVFESVIPIKRYSLQVQIKPTSSRSITVEKDEAVMLSLRRYLDNPDKTLSPSAINSFINCPLSFYFRYVADIKEPQKLNDDIDPSVFGQIVHKVMERLYWDAFESKKPVTTEYIKQCKKQMNEAIDIAFYQIITAKKDEKRHVFHGKELLIREIIALYAERILEVDAAYAPFTIVDLENDVAEGAKPQMKYRTPLKFSVDGEEKHLFLGGIIDRVDAKDGVVRLVDYKTGKDETAFESIEKLLEEDGKKNNKAVLQTFLYSHMYRETTQQLAVEPALYVLRKMKDKTFDGRIKEKKHPVDATYLGHLLEELMPLLQVTLGERLFNPKQPFMQTSEQGRCVYCPYNAICRREATTDEEETTTEKSQ